MRLTSILLLELLVGTVVHPKATIFAVAGPIVIGSNCIIEEGAVIVNRCVFKLQLELTSLSVLTLPLVTSLTALLPDSASHSRKEIMRIGDLNLFSVQSRVESPVVGNFNTFLPKSQTASTVRISNCCVVGAGCALLPTLSSEEEEEGVEGRREDEVLEPYTVLYLTSDGDGEEGRTVNRRTWDGKGEEGERDLRMKHVEYLREVSGLSSLSALFSGGRSSGEGGKGGDAFDTSS